MKKPYNYYLRLHTGSYLGPSIENYAKDMFIDIRHSNMKNRPLVGYYFSIFLIEFLYAALIFALPLISAINKIKYDRKTVR